VSSFCQNNPRPNSNDILHGTDEALKKKCKCGVCAEYLFSKIALPKKKVGSNKLPKQKVGNNKLPKKKVGNNKLSKHRNRLINPGDH
jgi:hypothetical protein